MRAAAVAVAAALCLVPVAAIGAKAAPARDWSRDRWRDARGRVSDG